MNKYIYLYITVIFLTSCVQNIEHTSLKSDQFESKVAEILSANKAFKSGDYKKAAAIYNEISNKGVDIDKYKFYYAESLRLSGETDKSVLIYDEVIASGSNVLNAMEGKSLAYVQDGQFKKAANILSQILNKDAARWRTINALGVIYATTGHLEESLKYYNMALDIDENNPSVINNIGLSIAFSGKFDDGKEIVEKALSKVGPEDSQKRRQIEYNLALINGVSGNMEKAQEILSRYLPEHQVMNNLGYYAKLSDDKDLARTYLSKALASSPVHYEKAWETLQSIDGKG